MVWGAFTSSGRLKLMFPSCRMNSAEYQEVLNEALVPFLATREDQSFIFQQDNASVHVSHSTKQWFEEHGITTLPWPACSPDLNPIENLWAILVWRVYLDRRQFGTVRDLKAAVIEAWETIGADIMKNLVDSMTNRLFQVINRNGAVCDHWCLRIRCELWMRSGTVWDLKLAVVEAWAIIEPDFTQKLVNLKPF